VSDAFVAAIAEADRVKIASVGIRVARGCPVEELMCIVRRCRLTNLNLLASGLGYLNLESGVLRSRIFTER